MKIAKKVIAALVVILTIVTALIQANGNGTAIAVVIVLSILLLIATVQIGFLNSNQKSK